MAIIPVNTTGSKGNLSDYQHAARLFVDGDMQLVPKNKFNFHVVFEYHSAALQKFQRIDPHRLIINMLVKKIDLPKFEIQTTTANQYNRKKVIQTKIEYKPINLSFHDDGAGVIRNFWESYFQYYYSDYRAAKDPILNYSRDAMLNHGTETRHASQTGADTYRTYQYGLDRDSGFDPFLTGITIYQMMKKRWNSYTLVNPVITSWNHDQLDYSNSNTLVEHNLTIAYEAVAYGNGVVEEDSPPGFGTPEYYDVVPSSFTLGQMSQSTGGMLNTIINQAVKS